MVLAVVYATAIIAYHDFHPKASFAATLVFGALSGNNAWTGVNTFSNFNNIIFVDGVTYPQTIAGINSALAVAAAANCEPVYLPPGTYSGTATVSITCNGQRLIGAGRSVTTINYTGNGKAVSFVAPTMSNWDSSGSIENLSITPTSSGTDAIYVSDTTGLKLSRIIVNGCTGSSGTALHLDNTGSTGIDFTERTLVEDFQVTNCTTWVRFTVTGSDSSFAYTRFIDLRGEFDVPNGVGISFENNAYVDQGYFLINGNINNTGATFYKLSGTATVQSGNWFVHHSELDLGGSYTLVNAGSGTTFEPTGFFSALGSPTSTGAGIVYLNLDQSLNIGNGYQLNFPPTNSGLSMGGQVLYSALPPSISSGFGTSPCVGATSSGTSCSLGVDSVINSASFVVNVGTGGSATTGILAMPTAANKWDCTFVDVTTHSNFPQQILGGSDTTHVEVGGFSSSGSATAWGASDILQAHCDAH